MDWIAYPFLIFQIYLLVYRPKSLSKFFHLRNLAFLCGLVASICFILCGITKGSIPMIVGNTVLALFNFRGYINVG